MKKTFKQKMIKYINDLEDRNIVARVGSQDGYTLFNIVDGYRMTYYPTAIDAPHAVEVDRLVIDYWDGQVRFECEDGTEVLIFADIDLQLLSNIHITVALSLEEDDPVDEGDRLTLVENRLDALNDLITKIYAQLDNRNATLNEIKEILESLNSEAK